MDELRFLTPNFIGRQEVRAALLDRAARAAQGPGRIAVISGEAGIGKSRLLHEVAAELAAGGWRELRVGCFEEDRHTPFSVVPELVRHVVALAPEAAAPVLAAYGSTLAQALPAGRLPGVVASNAERQADPQQLRLHIFACLQELLEIVADRPVLLAAEDVHWADEASLELLLRLGRRTPALPVFGIFTSRTEDSTPELEHVVAELVRQRVAEEVHLERLSLVETESMVRVNLGNQQVRADLLHALFRQTQGNPFFVEEIVRTLSPGGDAPLSNVGKDVTIPRTVREAVGRRLADLSPQAVSLIQIAAIAGVRFDFQLLKDVSGYAEADIVAALRAMVAGQLVVEGPSDHFAFRHALTREAVRAEMLGRERRALSLRVANSIERARGERSDERVEDLAELFFEAEEWPRAADYGLMAGRRAMALYSPGAALGHLNHALSAAERFESASAGLIAEIRHLRGSAHEAIGDFDAARPDYEGAIATTGPGDHAAVHWKAHIDLGLLWASRDYARAGPYFDEALRVAREMDDPVAVGHSLNRLGNWHSNTGDFQKARAFSEEALAMFRQSDDAMGVARTLDILGMTCCAMFDLPMAADYYGQAIELLESLGDRLTLTSALASIQIASGTYQTDMGPAPLPLTVASAYGQRALDVARQSGSRAAEAYAHWHLAFSLGPQGEYAAALEHGDRSLAIAREIDHVQWQLAAHCALAAIAIDMLEPAAALEHVDRAVRFADETGSPLWSWQARAVQIDCLAGLNRVSDALAVYREHKPDEAWALGSSHMTIAFAHALLEAGEPAEALEIASSLEPPTAPHSENAVRLRLLKGCALAALGRHHEALALLETGAMAAERKAHRSALWRIRAATAHLSLALNDRARARKAAADSVAVAAALGGRFPAGHSAKAFIARATEHLPASVRPRSSARPADVLTAREAEVARLIARGMTNREMADHLVVSPRTVETHVANAMSKLGFSARAQLAAWAADQGLLEPDA